MKTFISIISLFLFLTLSAFALEADNEFLNNIDESLTLRHQGIDFYQAHSAKFNNTDNLTHNDLVNIYNFSSMYIAHREKLLQEIELIQKEVRLTDRIVIRTDVKTGIRRNVLGLKTHYINPNEVEGRNKIRAINQATIYGLMLFDNYLALVAPYYMHTKVRYLLNRDFPGRDRQFDEIAANFFNIAQRKLLLKGIKIFEKFNNIIIKEDIILSSYDGYLNQLIATSPVVDHLKDVGSFEIGTLTHLIQRVTGELRFTARASTFQTSKLFGNTMGIFKSRDGYMRKFDEKQRNQIASKLKPLDVLLEKTPFRLTDSFIPGYYGHVAIWIGTEEELRELGIWDHPAIIPHQEKIRSGHHIVEALRPGVQINTLEHFLDIDDLAAIRPNDLSLEQTKEYLIRAFMQIGKDYDFNFDVETDNLIVCSEIAYVVFHNVVWPTDRMLGRSTISPDHVAWEAVPGKSFTPVLMYQNGIMVKEDKMDEVFLGNISGPERMK